MLKFTIFIENVDNIGKCYDVGKINNTIFILIVLKLSYYTDEGCLKDVEYNIKLDDPRHIEERFFFGLCPISLKTSYSEDGTSDSSKELKVKIKLIHF